MELPKRPGVSSGSSPVQAPGRRRRGRLPSRPPSPRPATARRRPCPWPSDRPWAWPGGAGARTPATAFAPRNKNKKGARAFGGHNNMSHARVCPAGWLLPLVQCVVEGLPKIFAFRHCLMLLLHTEAPFPRCDTTCYFNTRCFVYMTKAFSLGARGRFRIPCSSDYPEHVPQPDRRTSNLPTVLHARPPPRRARTSL